MSAPARTLATFAPETSYTRRYVEPNARRRTSDNTRMLRGVQPRGRSARTSAAVAANWAEWAD